MVLLHVENEKELVRAMRYLDDRSIRFRTFIDPDLDHEITSLASEPLFGLERKTFKEYKLLKITA